MRARLCHLLDLIAFAALVVAAAVLLTGGSAIAWGPVALSAKSVASPLLWALVAAGARRLLAGGGEADGIDRFARTLAAALARGFGPGGERLRGWLRLRADALVLALVALSVLDRGLIEPLRIDGDAVGYYAYLRSPLIDGDLDFFNEYRDHDPRQQWLRKRTPIGRVENPFAIGPALLWAPFFVVGWGAARIAAAAGEAVPIDGYSPPFVYATAAGTWLYGIAAVILLYRLLLIPFSRRTALLATLGTVFASPLAYYLPYSPHYSHTQSFFATVLFLWCWARTPGEASPARWALLGVASGLLALTRWQDAVYGVLPALTLAAALWRDGRRSGFLRESGEALVRGVAFLAALAATVSPQLLVFRLLNGAWFTVPQGDGFMTVWPKYLWPTLWSWNHGLYTWSPLLLLATLGLLAAARARRLWAGAFLLALAAHLYSNGCIWQWWAGHAFGARRFASVVPLFALGLGEWLRRSEARPRARRLLLALIVASVAWTHVLVYQWNNNSIPHGEAISPTAVLATAGRDLRELDVTALGGDRSVTGVAFDRIGDLMGVRLPALLAALAFYALARRRSEQVRAPAAD